MKDYLITLRPKQWIKNSFVFAALIFSMNIFVLDLFIRSCLAFLIFCLAASGVYIINDIRDKDQDSRHPVKKSRPIASGKISVTGGYILSSILLIIALIFSYYLEFWLAVVVLIYIVNNFFYSYYLKNVVLIDVFMIALGFLLRVLGGAVVIDVEISSWLIICTILLSLFLGFSKRRHELILLNDEAEGHRAILKEYSPYFLDQMISVVTASTLIAYSLYTMSPEVLKKFGNNNLQFTIPFVLYGIFRYLYLVHQKEKGGSPTKVLLTDIPLLLNVGLWVISVVLIIYLFG